MIRTFLATAGVVIAAATLTAPAAQACLSCEYKPEVLGNSSTESKHSKRSGVDAAVKARKAKPSKDYAEERKSEERRARAARKAAAAEDRRARTRDAKASTEKETVTTESSSEPTSTTSHSVYNTLIKTTEPIDRAGPASPTKVESAEKDDAAVTTPVKQDTSTAPETSAKKVDTADVSPSAADVVAEPTTTAAAPASEAVTVTQDKGSKETGCKKFFPMADLTLTVDCK